MLSSYVREGGTARWCSGNEMPRHRKRERKLGTLENGNERECDNLSERKKCLNGEAELERGNDARISKGFVREGCENEHLSQ